MLNKTVLLLVLLLLCGNIWSSAADKTDSGRSPYPALFERLKKMEGVWRAHSSKGWDNKTTIRVIARGSAILSTSEFVDQPGEGMATIFSAEKGNVLLTHYCESGTQPVLRAGSYDEKQNTVTFEFVGGTNLPSRDIGHMDKVIYFFPDDNHFNSQWTWYSKGKETWLEKIQYERVQ